MADAFIVKRGGGIGKLFAVIPAIYPAGATCTCSNGTKTLTAPDTSGKALFAIPEAGTWTVKAVLGDKSNSKSVSITTQGQMETVELSFELVLFENGVDNTVVTGGWSGGTVGNTLKLEVSALNASGTGEVCETGTISTKKAIDLAPYKTLQFLGVSKTGGAHRVGTQGATSTGTGNVNVDISKISAAQTIYMTLEVCSLNWINDGSVSCTAVKLLP